MRLVFLFYFNVTVSTCKSAWYLLYHLQVGPVFTLKLVSPHAIRSSIYSKLTVSLPACPPTQCSACPLLLNHHSGTAPCKPKACGTAVCSSAVQHLLWHCSVRPASPCSTALCSSPEHFIYKIIIVCKKVMVLANTGKARRLIISWRLT